jgi:hypothetical protein
MELSVCRMELSVFRMELSVCRVELSVCRMEFRGFVESSVRLTVAWLGKTVVRTSQPLRQT